MLCISGILFVSCGRKAEKGETASDVDKIFENVFKPDAEKVVLLSIKYNIEAIIVENLLEKYSSTPDYKIDVDKILKDLQKPNIEKIPEYYKKIIELSNNFGIPKEILASLIIDYEIWTHCEEGREPY